MKQPSKELNALFKQQGREAIQLNLPPDPIGERMVKAYGIMETIERLLLKHGNAQGYFEKLVKRNLLHLTFEHAVVMFPNEFSRDAVEVARHRLAHPEMY